MEHHRTKTLTLLSICSMFYTVLDEAECSIEYSPKVLGSTDFRRIRVSRWFVDKTMLLNDLVESGSFVTLVTYPRVWGKTTNMHMVDLYFSLFSASKEKISFENTNISRCVNCKRAQALQGKLPVITLDFGRIEPGSTEKDFLESMKYVIARSYTRYGYLKETIEKKYGANSEKLNKFNDYCSRDTTDYILRTKEITNLENEICEKEQRIYEEELRILELKKKKPYLDLLNEKTHKTNIELGKMNKTSVAEIRTRMNEIDSFYKPLLDEACGSSGQVQEELKTLRTSSDKKIKEYSEIKDGELKRLRDHLCESVEFLTGLLHEATGYKAIVLIDQYDAPVIKAALEVDRVRSLGYIFQVLTSFTGKTFNYSRTSNQSSEGSVYFGMITGRFQIGRESLLSKVSNLVECSMLKSPMFSHYGFSETEVDALMQRFRETNPHEVLTLNDLKRLYDGYKVPEDLSQTFYCPSSILMAIERRSAGNYFTESETLAAVKAVVKSGMMRPTIENLIKGGSELLPQGGLNFERGDLESLKRVSENTNIFTEEDKKLVLKLLLVTGYLTITTNKQHPSRYDVKAANQEIRTAFSRLLGS